MRAAIRTQYGGPEVLSVKEQNTPTPNKDEVLVQVHRTTVNRTDCGILRGQPFLIRFFSGLFKPSSSSPGTDFAGVIENVGNEVDRFKVGDRVFGLRDDGLASQREYMTFKASDAIEKIPEGISFNDVVASLEGAHYAYNFINKVKIDKGSQVLVNGGTGAIGSAAIQLLKNMGAQVTAVTDTDHIATVHALGPDKTVDYLKTDFTVDDIKYDFVFDAVGKSSFDPCKKLLKPNGVYISSELGPGAKNLYLPLVTKIKGGQRVIFPIPKDCKRSVKITTDLLSKGVFQPLIDTVYPMTSIQDAYTYVESGQKIGNVIIDYTST